MTRNRTRWAIGLLAIGLGGMGFGGSSAKAQMMVPWPRDMPRSSTGYGMPRGSAYVVPGSTYVAPQTYAAPAGAALGGAPYATGPLVMPYLAPRGLFEQAPYRHGCFYYPVPLGVVGAQP